MRIVFVGSVRFSFKCLQTILACRGNVVAILNPSRQRAQFNSDYMDLESLALRNNIPFYRIENINHVDTLNLVRSLKPDVMFIFGLSQLLSKELLFIPPRGCIGAHPALLPHHRGRHPLIWALVEGLTESGLTFFYLDEGADSGDIVWQKSFSINLQDDANTTYQKIEQLADTAIREFLPQLINGQAPRIPQDHSQASYWRKRTELDGEIQWSGTTLIAYNLIRALTRPYGGAHTFYEKQKVIIWRSELLKEKDTLMRKDVTPGEIAEFKSDSMIVKTGDGFLLLREWQTPTQVNFEPGHRFGN